MNMNDNLVKAASDGNIQAINRLLNAGPAIDGDGRIENALHAAIENENIACVQLLLRRGADLEYRTYGNLSPLAHAVGIAIDGTNQRGGKPGDEPVELITLLLDAGADPASGLEIAQIYGSSKITELLISALRQRLI